MKVVGVQLDIAWESKQANFDKVRELLERAKVEPGSLIVLPEMFATGFSMNVARIHEGEGEESKTFLKAMAEQYRSHVLGGVVTLGPDGRGRNEAVVIDPNGRERVRYAKMHPFSFAGETEHFVPGNKVERFEWQDFTVAPFICYDLRFPEVFREAVVEGAEILTVIACWPEAREAHWLALLKARAIENQSYVVGVNRCGQDPSRTGKPPLPYSGRSQIIDPKGEVLADGGEQEGTFSANLERSTLLEYRRDFPALHDIREEYKKR